MKTSTKISSGVDEWSPVYVINKFAKIPCNALQTLKVRKMRVRESCYDRKQRLAVLDFQIVCLKNCLVRFLSK